MSKTPVICINTYAGSLAVAAKTAGHEVAAVLEDAGYGQAIVQHNYPRVPYHATREAWPQQSLKDVLVIAHPPCAAFSSMNYANDPSRRGPDAVKFQQTCCVLEYALGAQAPLVAVESVPGALEGGRAAHERAAARHGYDVYRIRQDALTFGLPQQRERFWAVFARRGVLKGGLRLRHVPRKAVLADVLEGRPGPTCPPYDRLLKEQRAKLAADVGQREACALLEGRRGHGTLSQLLVRRARAKGDKAATLQSEGKRVCTYGSFQSAVLRVLDPQGHTHVLLHHSWWTVRGRNLSQREHMRVMGFPDEYVFPEREARYTRAFLSRGVCPPVARWLLEELERNLCGRATGDVVRPDDVYDVRPARGWFASTPAR